MPKLINNCKTKNKENNIFLSYSYNKNTETDCVKNDIYGSHMKISKKEFCIVQKVSHRVFLKFYIFESQRIPHNGYARERHRETGKDWRKQPSEERVEESGCERYADDIIEECPEEILLDSSHGHL